MSSLFPVKKFGELPTPFYYYDLDVLRSTIASLKKESAFAGYRVCESSDTFGKFVDLPETKRGDIIAIRSAGAYGEAMASRYNLRDLPGAVFSDEI